MRSDTDRERREQISRNRPRLFLQLAALAFCVGCGGTAPEVDYAGVSTACTTLKQAIIDAHGEEKTEQDDLDFANVTGACTRRLDELEENAP